MLRPARPAIGVNSFTTVHLNRHVGADYGAEGACVAAVLAFFNDEFGWEVAGVVQGLADLDDLFGTELQTEVAALTPLPVDLDVAFGHGASNLTIAGARDS